MLPILSYMLTLVLTCTTIFINVSPTMADNELKTYIVQLTSPKDQVFSQPQDLDKWYMSLLSESASISSEKSTMVHMYRHVMTGFAAKMSVQQAKAMEKTKGVLSVRPERVFQLHTTRSPHFLGLHQNVGFWKVSKYGKGIIIGFLDTGITPGHPSFNDEGIPSPPARWKGKCEEAGCNNKLIGIRNFYPSNKTPVDEVGHGTHTSSTAAGSPVHSANVFGNANGIAIGMAPLSHVAMYKVCNNQGCPDGAIAAGIDAAIEDGVDVISMSLGGPSLPFYDDVIAIGTFTAMQKGIFVSCSSGNSGPGHHTVSNEAPWILTVGASTIDRRIQTTVYLGNKKLYDGESLNQPKDFDHKLRPFVYPGKNGDIKAYCLNGSLEHIDVKGKVVLCDRGMIRGTDKSTVVKAAGGAAMILVNDVGETTTAGADLIPASTVGYANGIQIKNYFNSTSSPKATILFRGTVVSINTAPEVASFSSRGPSSASPGILNPDIIGPGVNILAAWPESVDNNEKTKATFNVVSGTSMSCPHLAGIVALLKSEHPDWSPAAIKSAIMTTASQVNLNKHVIGDQKDARLLPADVFAIGAGHVDPSKSNDPGLVFDIQPSDYIPYLCGLGYTLKQIEMITKKNVSCSKTIPEAQLNYPSFMISLKGGDKKTYSRTVTNVGVANSTYKVGEISVPDGVKVVVKVVVSSLSQELTFTSMHHKLTYNITFSQDSTVKVKGTYGQGHMTWVSGKYSVRTPFAFKFE